MTTSLRELLQGIYDQQGKLTPALVVQTARDPEHPLHERFEWDDSVAAEKWRLEQGHQLITTCRLTYRGSKGESKEVRSFHAFRSPDGGYQYEPGEKVARDGMLSQLLKKEMERDWKTLKRRYEQWDEFRQMVIGDLDGEAKAA